MTWLALADGHERRPSLLGLGAEKRTAPVLADDPRSLLTRGSIVVATRMSPDGRPQVLFGYRTTRGSPRSLCFKAIPGGGIAFVQAQGREVSHAVVQRKGWGRTESCG